MIDAPGPALVRPAEGPGQDLPGASGRRPYSDFEPDRAQYLADLVAACRHGPIGLFRAELLERIPCPLDARQRPGKRRSAQAFSPSIPDKDEGAGSSPARPTKRALSCGNAHWPTLSSARLRLRVTFCIAVFERIPVMPACPIDLLGLQVG